MDLNASPLPEDEEEEEEYVFEEQEHEEHGSFEPDTHRYPQPQSVNHAESSVETLRREREERRQRLKREHPDERPKRVYQPPKKVVAVENKTTRFYDRDKLPPGWLDCPASGKAVGFMIPSKVPLGEYFHDFIVPGKRYSLRQVIHQQRVLGRELGLVIDLTNTTRYYPPADWKKQGIKHVKIACRGRDSVPDHESVNNFVYEVLQFSARQKHTKKFVLVHCTHGHNRTGFMIVHFLMRSQPMSVTKAIQIFANARPPGIYKQDYIDALYAFYHEKPEAAVCPPTPEWKRSSNLDLNGEALPDDDGDDDDDGVAAPLHEDHVLKEVMTNDDILGDAIPYEQQEAMRQFCYQSLKLGAGAKGTSQFPGSHPVSLNRENLQLLRQRYYYATWKADGTRYMMLITCDGCYLIDRSFNFRRVQMRFPSKQPNDSGLATHNLTLLDGEMVIDTHPDTRKQERRYLIYDLIAVNQVSVVERPFCERWKMLEEEVIQPRNIEREKLMMFENEENQQRKIELERQFTQQNINPYYIYEMEPFRVRRKGFWLLSTVTKLLEKFIPGLSHEADGLIFQGWDDPYVPRTHEGLLKWKYAEMNSVDFLFELVDDNRPQLFLYERGRKKLMEGNLVVFRDESDPSTYSGKIIECSWDSEEGVWVCMRIRVDKSTPNDFNTYKKVMRSIKDNITEEVLLKEIDEIVRLPMYTDRTRKIPLRK